MERAGPPTRASLVLRLRDFTDGRAWFEFIDVYTPFLRRVLLRRGVPEGNADDVVQQTFDTLLRQIGQFDYDQQRGRFRDWLVSIALRKCQHFFRSRSRRPGGMGGSGNVEIIAAIPGECDDPDWLHRRLQIALERTQKRVHPLDWLAFEMTVLQNVDNEEAARRLGISAGHLYCRKARVKRAIVEIVEELDD